MAVNMTSALNAYTNAAKRSGGMGKDEVSLSKTNAPSTGGNTFAEMVKGTVEQAVDANQAAERLATKAMAGQADVRDVVTAVNNAEIALQTVVAVRDRVVTAYQEIMKMPI